MPDILNPYVCAGCKEEPVDWDEEKTDHIWREGDANKENWEGLQINY